MLTKRIFKLVLITILSFLYFSCSKDTPEIIQPDPVEPPLEEKTLVFPKKEMRAVWITTAWELDWPQGEYSEDAQKKKYINYLDRFRDLNINTVFFQVKPMGDAFYKSSYEPWSKYITGERGKEPTYDVLRFLIDEAHARNIEFHAWMNPYRISAGGSYPPLHPSIVPSWILKYENSEFYNPAIPEVRERLVDIVKELITQYDVDGIHFDDYFYPGPNVSDNADYEKYGKGYNTVEEFRRANVDKTIESVYKAIVATKPEIVFSISPTSDNDYNFNSLFANVIKWDKEGWIDVVIPQLYHEINHSTASFRHRLNWWSQYNYNAALMVGHGLYKFGDPKFSPSFQTTFELEKQFDLTRKNKKVVGNVMYRAQNIIENKIGITDQLAAIYKNEAVIPFLGRTVAPEPSKPVDVRLESGTLKWITKGDVRSVIYYFENKTKEGKVFAITDKNSYLAGPSGYYCISTINVDNKESEISDLIKK